MGLWLGWSVYHGILFLSNLVIDKVRPLDERPTEELQNGKKRPEAAGKDKSIQCSRDIGPRRNNKEQLVSDIQ